MEGPTSTSWKILLVGFGAGVGFFVDIGVGVFVGTDVAADVGLLVGESVGTRVGLRVGAGVAAGVGLFVGTGVAARLDLIGLLGLGVYLLRVLKICSINSCNDRHNRPHLTKPIIVTLSPDPET